MASKKELVLKVFHNEPVERIPVGFWFHFLELEQFNLGLDYPELMEKVVEGHKKFKEDFDPDFVKIMSDGLFFRPRTSYPTINCPADLRKIQRLPKDHRYFEASVKLVKDVCALYDEDTLVFFNMFSPLYHFTHMLNGSDDPSKALSYLMEDPEAVVYALDIISQDLRYLVGRMYNETRVDGIYLCVNNAGRTIPADLYTKYVSPAETAILAESKKYSEHSILHICGWRGRINILSVYRDYDAEVFNWAVHEEGMNLAEGKKYFHGKAVIGGFDQMPGSMIHTGTKEEIQAEVEKLIEEGGKVGIIVGADCTVPNGTPIENLKWAREKAAELS